MNQDIGMLVQEKEEKVEDLHRKKSRKKKKIIFYMKKSIRYINKYFLKFGKN